MEQQEAEEAEVVEEVEEFESSKMSMRSASHQTKRLKQAWLPKIWDRCHPRALEVCLMEALVAESRLDIGLYHRQPPNRAILKCSL